MLYHASPCADLHRDGLKRFSKPTCCNRVEENIYLGSLEYLHSRYFKYCPKGIYYIFEVDTENLNLEYLDNVDHYLYNGDIESQRIEPHGVKVVI